MLIILIGSTAHRSGTRRSMHIQNKDQIYHIPKWGTAFEPYFKASRQGNQNYCPIVLRSTQLPNSRLRILEIVRTVSESLPYRGTSPVT
jgi:hypothetical protein